MNPDAAYAFLLDFHETVLGLRTAQIGRANAHLAQLINKLSRQLELMPVEARQETLPAIGAMLAARERDDAIALADVLQYELPSRLSEGEISPTLLDAEIILGLRAKDRLIREPAGIDALAEAVHSTHEDYPQAKGVAAFYAGRLCQLRRFSDARRLLELDEAAGRRTPASAYLLALCQAERGDFERAQNLMQWAYDNSQTLTDGYARLGRFKADAGDWHGAIQVARNDDVAGRLTPTMQIAVAQWHGRQGEFAAAARQIDDAYARQETVRDGFARLGWIQAEANDWPGALEMGQRDESARRLTPGWKINLAQLYGRCGDFVRAAELIDEAYSQDAALQDGFTRLGWVKMEQGDCRSALDLARRDEAGGRLTPGRKVNLAMLYGRQHEFEHAVALIEAAYRDDDSLHDGYTRLGWKKRETGDLAGALALAAKDEAMGRMTPQGRTLLALIHGHLGDFDNGAKCIESAYAQDASVNDGFAALGWVKVERGDVAAGLDMMRRDIELDRITAAWRQNFDRLLADNQWRP